MMDGVKWPGLASQGGKFDTSTLSATDSVIKDIVCSLLTTLLFERVICYQCCN